LSLFSTTLKCINYEPHHYFKPQHYAQPLILSGIFLIFKFFHFLLRKRILDELLNEASQEGFSGVVPCRLMMAKFIFEKARWYRKF